MESPKHKVSIVECGVVVVQVAALQSCIIISILVSSWLVSLVEVLARYLPIETTGSKVERLLSDCGEWACRMKQDENIQQIVARSGHTKDNQY